MRNQKGFTLNGLLLATVIIISIAPYIWNGVKFASCDFEAGWKCEVIHGIGVVVPPASLITVWFADDAE